MRLRNYIALHVKPSLSQINEPRGHPSPLARDQEAHLSVGSSSPEKLGLASLRATWCFIQSSFSLFIPRLKGIRNQSLYETAHFSTSASALPLPQGAETINDQFTKTICKPGIWLPIII